MPDSQKDPKNGGRTFVGLHLMLAIYSLSSVCSKLAAGYDFLSPGFILFYGAMIALLAFYAIAWQQVIKRLPLTTAYANKAVTLVWGLIWGLLIFHEPITPTKLMGALLVLAGVVLFSVSDTPAENDGDGEAT